MPIDESDAFLGKLSIDDPLLIVLIWLLFCIEFIEFFVFFYTKKKIFFGNIILNTFPHEKFAF